MSTKSAGLAKKMGYSNIRVMLKGAPGWKKSGRMLVASDEFVESGNIILLDVRPGDEAAKGFIPRAVNIPLGELEDAADDFPVRAPVVVYGGEDARRAGRLMASWGIKNVALIDGGLEGYVARGHALTSGEPPEDISWSRKLGENEVAPETFLAVAGGKAGDSVILDVRTPEEAAGGRFPNSIAIPLDELEKRLDLLPRNKTIIAHCSTGARAEIAQAVLAKKGFTCKFLVADVRCENGECDVE